MAMNRVQFQPGLSMPEFMQRYGTEAQCEQALARARWPQGFACPVCGGEASSSFRRQGRLYWQCTACRHQCSATSGTIFESTKLALRVWFLAMQLLTQSKNNVAALELRRQLGVSYPTAWLIKHKLMEVMRLREDTRRLSGHVQMDDAYLGGKRSGGTVGRGSENKVSFIAAVQATEEGKPHLACFALAPFTKEAVRRFARKSLQPPFRVVSDGLDCFMAVQELGEHERIVTGGGGASVKVPQLRAINIVLSNLKTAMSGTYHAVKFAKYAPRYLAELQYRFNRRYALHELLGRLLRACSHTQPRTNRSIRLTEGAC